MSLQKKFSDNFRTKGFPVTEPVLLAVSGGVDSMVMAQMFLTAGLPFGLAHCNFQLRGEESDKDEQLVLDWCAQHNVPMHHVRFDTQEKVEEWKKGIQETARILRYDWLEKVRLENGFAAIATAHHANDNAETLLMNLFKGTGISGLHGIPVTNGRIIRPLLFAAKNDILAYAEEHAVPYRNDASNSTDKYLRNDVRLNILPVVQKAFPNVISNLNNSIQRFAEVEMLYHKAVEAELKKLLEKRGNDYYIPVRKMLKADPLPTICYELFKKFGFATGQINDIIALLNSESGHYVSSATHRVIRNRDFLIITVSDTPQADFVVIDKVPGTIAVGGKQYKFQYKQLEGTVPADENIAYINTAKLEQPLILRRWRQGDYLYPLGMGMKKKKVSRYLIDKKIPVHEKENVLVLESNKRVVWIAGHRLDERFKVTPATTVVLIVKRS